MENGLVVMLRDGEEQVYSLAMICDSKRRPDWNAGIVRLEATSTNPFRLAGSADKSVFGLEACLHDLHVRFGFSKFAITNRIDPTPGTAHGKLGCLIWQFGNHAELELDQEEVLFVKERY